jgi:hypothetical protein
MPDESELINDSLFGLQVDLRGLAEASEPLRWSAEELMYNIDIN